MEAENDTAYGFDFDFYADLNARRESFTLVRQYTIPAGTGYGFRVESGQTFRFVIISEPQIADVCVYNADDLTEHYASGAQAAIEGEQITRFTRLWGTPPRSRPLATCLADTVRPSEDRLHIHGSSATGAHCNPHMWMLYSGRHPRTCYDNLRAALAMLGLSQHHIHDNFNLFQRTLLEAYTGETWNLPGEAEPGDYIEFYAELPLLVAVSLCPNGNGSMTLSDWEREVPVFPLGVEIYDTDTSDRERA